MPALSAEIIALSRASSASRYFWLVCSLAMVVVCCLSAVGLDALVFSAPEMPKNDIPASAVTPAAAT